MKKNEEHCFDEEMTTLVLDEAEDVRVDVYLERGGGNPKDPAHREAILTIVQTALTVSVVGLTHDNLTELARFLYHYARKLEDDP